MSDKCPKCDAKKTSFDGQCSWECGSYEMYVPGLNPFWAHAESEHCRCRQKLERMKAGIKKILPDFNCRMFTPYYKLLKELVEAAE